MLLVPPDLIVGRPMLSTGQLLIVAAGAAVVFFVLGFLGLTFARDALRGILT